MTDRRLEFDPNVHHDGFASVLNDHSLALQPGDIVTVYEPEDDIQAPARVESFWGVNNKYVLLDVDWAHLTGAGDSDG